jgi:hypothetical protein
MSPAAVAPVSSAQVLTMQGIQVPAQAVNPPAFFAGTRRQNLLQKTLSATAGFGSTDLVPILQTGVISALSVRIFGNLVVTPGTGTVASTYQWPYNYLRAIRFTANGQSNLINVSGTALKLINLADRGPIDDRGVQQQASGVAVQQGTLSLASESWGVGIGATAIPAGTYDVELLYDVPIAYDQVKTLQGAIFAQTASTDLELAFDYNLLGSLFTLTGNAAVTFTPTMQVEGTVYTIPSVGGSIAIPNLSAFHSLIESRAPNNIAQGINEIALAGQGVGRKLMRLAFRTFSAGIPLQMNAANYGQLYWRYGGNTTPEQFADGRKLRQWDEDIYNSDIGAVHGYGMFDFSSLWAQRDSIDEGSATQLRFGMTVVPALTTPYTEYVQQTLVAGAVAA